MARLLRHRLTAPLVAILAVLLATAGVVVATRTDADDVAVVTDVSPAPRPPDRAMRPEVPTSVAGPGGESTQDGPAEQPSGGVDAGASARGPRPGPGVREGVPHQPPAADAPAGDAATADPATPAPGASSPTPCDGEGPTIDAAGLWVVDDGAARRILDETPSAVTWSPSGDHLAALSDVDEARVLDLVAVDGGSRRLATGPHVEQAGWSDDGRLVYVTGGEVVAISPLTGLTQLVYAGESTAPLRAAVGRHQVVVVDGARLVLVDLRTGQSRRLSDDAASGRGMAIVGADRFLAYGHRARFDAPDLELRHLDLASGAVHVVGRAGSVLEVVASPDGRHVAWETVPAGGGQMIVHVSELDGHDGWAVASPAAHPGFARGSLVYAHLERGIMVAEPERGGGERVLHPDGVLTAIGDRAVAFAGTDAERRTLACAVDVDGQQLRRVAQTVPAGPPREDGMVPFLDAQLLEWSSTGAAAVTARMGHHVP